MSVKARGYGFGTLPVFLAGISTILGAIMFLRFGYAVAHTGLLGVIGIILLGHLVTIPTALALAEIATNRKVEGGGEYFIISRSFGTTIGGVIGICLYLSQAISVAFYMIAFAEAFTWLEPFFSQQLGVGFDSRFISIPALIMLLVLVIFKGADLGIKVLYVVAAILFASLLLFFLGSPVEGFDRNAVNLADKIQNSDSFIIVFAIVFPAFTGMTAGVGLSGDLRNPRRSLPRGTLWATITGMVVYLGIVYKFHVSASPEMMAEDQLIMSQISVWGPAILIGLCCATLSSAIGSVLVAPRTLQALGADNTLPGKRLNVWMSQGTGVANDPRHATLITGILALIIVVAGSVDLVATLISMFFMVTYGSLCAISFLEHFAARPSYRPSFRSRWYISLFGAIVCFLLMFQINLFFATIAILVLVALYQMLRIGKRGEADLASLFQNVITQATRYMQIRLQQRRTDSVTDEWRPSVIMVNDRTFDRRSPLMMLRWLCHRYGFGTYVHFIKGRLTSSTFHESKGVKERLLKLAKKQQSAVYMDTVVSPSITSALAQTLQVPGVSGMSNNSILFEFAQRDSEEVVKSIVDQCKFAANTDMTLMVLRHCETHFGNRDTIHVWLTWNDKANANTMILLSYILLGHPDWMNAQVQVFAALPGAEVKKTRREFAQLINEGRLPISEKNIEYMATDDIEAFRRLVYERSSEADLTVVGFDMQGLKERGLEVFTNHSKLHDVLFVRAPRQIKID
ncbi:MAG: amino acid permease [Bacteroidetes bacterium]|nr:amino acid permease [Bacteroidota bacterium]MCY4205625.1 amino acid permease [Bacteroidota bacterium]